jgi:hypothetical protein
VEDYWDWEVNMSLIDIALMAVIIAGAVYLLCRSMCKKKGHCPGCDSGMCKTKGEKKYIF